MIVDISRMPEDGLSFTGNECSFSSEFENDDSIQIKEDLSYNLFAQVVSETLIVTGKLSLPLSLRCSRCAELFQTTIYEPSFQCARDLSEESESVDLTGDIREAILLLFPAYPVCGSDCKGLCSECGTNLNTDKCSCVTSGEDPWSALDTLGILEE